MESPAAELTRECEALVSGSYADHLRHQGRWVPPWGWVNALAHRSEDQLAAIAAGAAGDGAADPPGLRDWRQALVFLADDVLRHVKATGISLRQLQATTLVPLELHLMGLEEGRLLDAGQLAAVVLAAVHEHPSRPRL